MTTETKLLGVPIEWQSAGLYETKRGKQKRIITGIPGQAFWHHWKRQGVQLKAAMKGHGITLQRLAKGQWEVRLWINRQNIAMAEDLALLAGLTLPDEPANLPSANEPF